MIRLWVSKEILHTLRIILHFHWPETLLIQNMAACEAWSSGRTLLSYLLPFCFSLPFCYFLFAWFLFYLVVFFFICCFLFSLRGFLFCLRDFLFVYMVSFLIAWFPFLFAWILFCLRGFLFCRQRVLCGPSKDSTVRTTWYLGCESSSSRFVKVQGSIIPKMKCTQHSPKLKLYQLYSVPSYIAFDMAQNRIVNAEKGGGGWGGK